MNICKLIISCFIIVLIIAVIGVVCIEPIKRQCRAIRMVSEIKTSTEFGEIVNNQSKNSVVLVYRPGCPACVHAKKTYTDLLKNDDVDELYSVHFSVIPDFMQQNKIRGVPVYVYSKNKSYLVGTGPADTIMDKIRNSTQRIS